MRPLSLFRLLACAAALQAAPSVALETDQYLAWGIELEDAAPAVNEYLNAEVEEVLRRVGRGRGERLSCEELPPKIYRHLFAGLHSSRLRRFLEFDPGIDRYPSRRVGNGDYKRRSIFRAPAFPFVLPMSRTIRIGEVYLGTDKVNHVFGFGRRYYERYQRALRRGVQPAEALRRVVIWGLRIEQYFVGGLADGVFSYGDLEGNYQGLVLGLDLCREGHLERAAGGWRLARPLDIRRYVTPALDESYYNSHYHLGRWRSIRKIFEEEYCERYLGDPAVRARFAAYHRVDRPSPARAIVADYFARRRSHRQLEHSLEALCPAAGAPQWVGAPAAERPE